MNALIEIQLALDYSACSFKLLYTQLYTIQVNNNNNNNDQMYRELYQLKHFRRSEGEGYDISFFYIIKSRLIDV